MPCLLRGLLLAACFFAGGEVRAQKKKSELTEHYASGPVRVFYAVEGPSAVDLSDQNSNAVPDRVDDVVVQAHAAYEIFCGVLGFPDPFESERYPGANCFQVSIVAKERIKGLNGVAYRKAQRARPIPEGKDYDRALVMAVANTVDASRNLTPAHEIFHLIQYGSTYFGNSWYLEGMARWSEKALGKGGAGKSAIVRPDMKWPQEDKVRAELYGMKYEASLLLWNPIAVLSDPAGEISRERIPESIWKLRYSNGEPVLKDNLLHGAPLMKDILLELSKLDDRKQRGFHPDSWNLDEQNAPENDPYIYEAVMNAMRRNNIAVDDFEAGMRP